MLEVRALTVPGLEQEPCCYSNSQIGTTNQGLFCLHPQCLAPNLAEYMLSKTFMEWKIEWWPRVSTYKPFYLPKWMIPNLMLQLNLMVSTPASRHFKFIQKWVQTQIQFCVNNLGGRRERTFSYLQIGNSLPTSEGLGVFGHHRHLGER